MNDGLFGFAREPAPSVVGVGVLLIVTSQAWVCPLGVYSVDVEIISGGGGAGGVQVVGCLQYAYYSAGSNGGTSSAFGITLTGGNGYNNSPAASISVPADNPSYTTAYGFLHPTGYGNPGTDAFLSQAGAAGARYVGRARVVPGTSYNIVVGGGGGGGAAGTPGIPGGSGVQGAVRLRW